MVAGLFVRYRSGQCDLHRVRRVLYVCVVEQQALLNSIDARDPSILSGTSMSFDKYLKRRVRV